MSIHLKHESCSEVNHVHRSEKITGLGDNEAASFPASNILDTGAVMGYNKLM